MITYPRAGDKVYVNFHNRVADGVIVSDLSAKMFDNPGTVYVVRLIIDGSVFVKAISIYHLSDRVTATENDLRLRKQEAIEPEDRGYSAYKLYPYFYKSYRSIQRCPDGINRRRKPLPSGRSRQSPTPAP